MPTLPNQTRLFFRRLVVAVIFSVLVIPTFPAPKTQAASETVYDGTNTGLNGDDYGTTVPMGFNFTYYGTSYSSVHVTTNGTLIFGSENAEYTNTGIPNAAAPNNFIAAFWDDLTTDNSTGSYRPSIYYYTLGSTPGSRIFIVQWSSMFFYNTTIQMGTFQAYLYEGSNSIHIQYVNLLGGSRSLGNSATIGIENAAGTAGIQYSSETASLTSGQVIRFEPNGGSYTMGTAAYNNILLRDTANPAPDVPVLTSPANGATGVSTLPTFTWDAAANATSYRLIRATDSNFSTGVVAVAGIATTSYTLGTPLSYLTTYYWRIEASNANGTALSGYRSFQTMPEVNVDPNAPTSLGPAAKVNGSYSTATEPALTFSVSDNNAADTVSYQIQIDDTADFSSPVIDYTSALAAQGARTYNVGQVLGDGAYYWRVRSYDAAELVSAWSTANAGGVAFRVDTTAPTVPGTASTTTPTATNKPAWTWTASTDGGSGLASPAYTVQWSKDATFATGVSSATSATASYTHGTALADGTWYFRAKATDVLGTASAYSTNGNVLVDTTAPSIPGVPSGVTPTADTTPLLSWTASTDTGSGLAATPYSLQWSKDDTFDRGVSTAAVATTSYSPSSSLSDGTWYFRVRASDVLASWSSYSAAGSIVVDSTSPTVPGTPSSEDLATVTTPTWTWTAPTDVTTGLAETPYTVEWSLDPEFVTGVETGTADTATYTHTVALADGLWYFRVRATDNVDNASDYSEAGTFLVDTTAPTLPTVITSPILAGISSPTWSWITSTDEGSGLATLAYTVEWSSEPAFASPSYTLETASLSAVPPMPLADGTWYFRIKVTDSVGNTSVYCSSESTRIDTVAPTVPGVPTAVLSLYGAKPTWSWDTSTDDGSGLANPSYTAEWSQDPDFVASVFHETSATAAYEHAAALAAGTWYFRVKSTDLAGNSSAYSLPGTVTVVARPVVVTPKVAKVKPVPAPVVPPVVVTPDPTPIVTTLAPITRDIEIKVVDDNGNPVEGARVELHSTLRVAYTDARGIARFASVEKGDREVKVFYRDQEKSSEVSVGTDSSTAYAADGLTGSTVKHLTLTLDPPKTTVDSSINLFIAYAAGVATALLALWIIGRRRRNS